MTEPLPWTHIYERVKSQIPAAPDPLIRQEFWSTMLDFTADTNIWAEDVPINIVANQKTYPFVVEDDGWPYRLMVVYDPAAVNGTKQWVENGIAMRVPGIITLSNKPTSSKSWIATVAKVVQNPQTTGDPPASTGYPAIAAWIVSTYNDVIYYGVMYFMQRMPNKPWGNPQASAVNYENYVAGKSIARVNNMRGNVFDGQNWTYPQTFRTITRKGWT